jgi:hypothetical protein
MGFRFCRRAAGSVSFILSAIVAPAALSAQAVVRGVLYDDATGAPLRGTVMLVDPATDAAVVHSTTDSLGQFDLKTSTGVYQIAAVRPGYTSVLSAPIQLMNGERMTIRVPIAENGDPQHHIGVLEHVKPDAAARAAQMMRQAIDMGGFESRRAVGTGLHYTRKDFDKTTVATLGEFLQTVPGLSVRDPESTASMSSLRNAMSSVLTGGPQGVGACHLGWFIDGHRMDLPGRIDPITDGLGTMQLDNIEALEIFRGLSEMPPEFAEPDLRCGAIAVWTRHGG